MGDDAARSGPQMIVDGDLGDRGSPSSGPSRADLPRNVTFIGEFVGEDSPATAFARRVRSLSTGLAKLGFLVTLATTESGGETASGRAVQPVRLRPGAARGRNANRLRDRLLSVPRAARLLADTLRHTSPHTVILSFHDPLFGVVLTGISRLDCSRVIFDVQDSWIVLELEHPTPVTNRIRKMLERTALRIATDVTTVSDTLGEMIGRSYRIRKEKIHTIHNGADPVSPSPSLAKDIDLIHLGSPRQYYATHAFVEALHVLAGRGCTPSVVFLGCTNEPYVDEVKRRAKEFGLSRIDFRPPVPASEVAGWLGRASVGIHTLTTDPIYRCAIGTKVLEYLASGLPVVHLGPRDGETARLLDLEGCGVVTSDVPEFARALFDLLTDSAKRQRLSERARVASRRHTWEASARKLTAVIEPLGEGMRE